MSPPANLAVLEVDLEQPLDEELQKLWKAQTAERLPWIVVQVPGSDGQMHPFWSGSLESADFKQLVDSPLRRTIGRHLLAGESAVWLLVEGGNKQRDDDAFQLLQTRLKTLEREIELPVPDPSMVATDLALKLSFPLVRVSRNDANENLFLRLLFFHREDLSQADAPVVVPIFGRGRALVCLSGSDINSRQIDQLGLFLGGQCSCEVKEQSPGYDLLMAVDWDSIFREHAAAAAVSTTRPADVTTESHFVGASNLPANTVIAPFSTNPEKRPPRTTMTAAVLATAALVVMAGFYMFRPSRGRRGRGA
jgi:hypothetical protein